MKMKMKLTYTGALVVSFLFSASGQDPTHNWKPLYTSLGIHCAHGLPGNDGDCGCENTPFRNQNGTMFMMESVETHPCEKMFPVTGKGNDQPCGYFRIRELKSGRILANISDSVDHDFCAAVTDHRRDKLWVFCSACGRHNKVHPGPCETHDGCYVGAWSTQLSGDFSTWAPMAKALTLPVGMGMYNNDVTLVSGAAAEQAAKLPGALPPHQAVMIIEGRSNSSRSEMPEFAINTGTDGDLSMNWILLNGSEYKIGSGNSTKLPDGEGTGDAPTLRYDSEEGMYYSIGGGWITNGPARSKTLKLGSWEVSPYAPMAIPASKAANASLIPIDQMAGINTALYSNIWSQGIPDNVAVFIKNMTKWNFGVTDPDVCCNDDKSPSYMIHTLSQQGGSLPPGTKSFNAAAIGSVNLTLGEWFRSYFPPK